MDQSEKVSVALCHNYHGGVVHADDRRLVRGRQALHHRHQEDRHVEHRLQAGLVTRERGEHVPRFPR